jgi:hypothetical protein
MLDEAGLLKVCVTGSPEVLAAELVRAMARLSPSAPPAAVQLAKGVLDLAMSLCSSPTVLRQLVDCALDQTQLWVPGTQATTVAAVVGTQSTARTSRGGKSRPTSAAAASATSDEVGPLFFGRFKEVIAAWLLTAEGWPVAVPALIGAMKSCAASGHNHPWSVLSSLLDSCDNKPVVVVPPAPHAVEPLRKLTLRSHDAVDAVLPALPGLDSWISDADVSVNVLNDLIALIDRLGSMVPSLYLTTTPARADSARFLESAIRRLFSDAVPVPVKVWSCWVFLWIVDVTVCIHSLVCRLMLFGFSSISCRDSMQTRPCRLPKAA